jgi:ABC-type branched-subunit amino acid transport system substrate-binding protein
MTGREALLATFDRLFDKAAQKLNLTCTPEERAEAKQQFEQRFEAALEIARGVEVREMPTEVLDQMEQAIERLSPAEIVGLLASVPLAHQTHDMLRAIAFRAAEQRLLEHYISQADTKYGGN